MPEAAVRAEADEGGRGMSVGEGSLVFFDRRDEFVSDGFRVTRAGVDVAEGMGTGTGSTKMSFPEVGVPELLRFR